VKVPKISVRKIPAIVMATIIAMSIGVALVASPASAATTSLISTSFTTNTTGVGQWVLPTASGTNQACLTANPTTGATSIPHCTSGNETAGTGALRLTTNVTTQVGSVFNTTSLPATQGLDISFDTYQFDQGSGTPADGISFTLAAANPTNPQPPATAGPSGGSLGYSTDQTASGVPNGYLGIGFDVYGNFLNKLYGGSTCPTVGSIGSTNYPQNVTVRGPGNGTSGYCLVTTTANTASPSGSNNLPGGTKTLDNPTATTHGATDVVPVEIAVNPSATAATTASLLSVPAKSFLVDFTPVGGTPHSFTAALPNLVTNAESIPAAWFDPTTGVPYQLTFGWTASTGGSIEYHDITTLTSSTLNGPLPTMALSDTDNASGVFKQGTATTNVTLTPSLGASAAETNPPTVTDTFPTGVVPGTPTGTNWNCAASAGQTVSCTYTGGTVAASASYPPITVPISVTGSATKGAGTDSAKASSIDALPVAAADNFTVELLPGAPTAVSAVARDASATVSFTAPVNDGGSAVTGYTITPYIAGVAQTPQTFNSTATTESVTGLTSGTAYTFKVAAINDVGTGPDSAATGAVTPLPVPTITTATLPAGEVGVAYSQTVDGTGGRIPYGWSVTTGSLPAGLSLNAATGLISGTPTTAGSPTFTVTLTDANSTTATQSYTLTVVANPSITTTSVPGGEVGAPYSQTLVGTGGTAPLTWSVTTGALPAGLTLNASTGVISGSPTTAGSPTFIVTLTDANGKKATQSYTLAVVIGPSITTPSLPSGEVGVAYNQPLAGAGGTTPYTWTVTTGSLPAGLSLNSATGVISGSPTTAGSPTFTVTLTDASLQTTTKAYTVDVAAVPSITTPSLPSGEVGVAYSQTLAGTGGATPYTWAVTTGSLPAGLSLNSSTGVISGSPTTAGSPTFTVTLTDANSQTATHSYTVGILAAPSITTTTLPGGEVGVPYNQPVIGAGGSTPYSWSVTAGSLPAGLTLNTSTGVISGSPTTAGSPTFTVTLTDANNQTASQGYTVGILAAPSITTTTLPGGEVGAPYSQPVIGAGGATPYTWAVTTGSLPAGLALNSSTGVISGSPTTAGSLPFTVTLTDANSQTATHSYTVGILAAPSITTTTLPDGEVGAPYSQTLVGAGGSTPYTWSVVGSLPAGLSLNPATGVISGTPTGSGPSTFTVTLIDFAGQMASQSYTLTVLTAPIITTVTLPGGELGVPYSQTVAGAGGTGPYSWSVVGSLPAGLTLDSATGVISGTPTGSGPSTFTVTLTDAASQMASQSYTVTILVAPSITTTTLPSGENSVPYSQTLAGAGGTGPYTWSVTAGSLPSGLTLEGATGVISGTPTSSGPFTFTVTLTDANNQTASQAYTVGILAAPSITTATLPDGEVGAPYSQTLAGTGGTGPYTWSVTAGTLPAGLSLDGTTGVISGTPTSSGPFTFTVTLTDANNQTASQTYTVGMLTGPSITTTILPGGEVGAPYSQTVIGTGGSTPYAWAVTAGSLPAGLTLNGATGVISGTPTGSGPSTFTVTLTDAASQTASQAYTVGILAAPSITTTTLPGGEVGAPYSQTVIGTGGSTPYAWAVTAGSLPAGLTLNGATAVISGTPTTSGPASFTVTVTDAASQTASQAYTVGILAAPSITTATLPGGEVGAPYSQPVIGAGGSTPYAWAVTAGSLPAGLNLNGATGVISGTPTAASGTALPPFTVTLTDANNQTAAQSYTVAILAAPSITTTIVSDGEVGAPYSQTLTGTGGTGPYAWSVTAGSLPAGLTLNPSTGVISGTPTGSGPTPFTFTVTLTDSKSQTSSQDYAMTIVAAPSITTTTLPDGEVGGPYSQTLAGTGGTGPYTWSVTAGSLPAGLTVDGATGVISGTPTGSGPATFTVTLTDAANQTASQAYTVGIVAAPSITTTTLPGGEVGAPYSQTLAGTGGTGPYTWSVTAGTLPAGLTLDGATGVISGTPTGSGPATFTITLTDAANQTASQAYPVSILAAPSITTTTLPGGEVGAPYSQAVMGAGGTGPYTWSVTAGTLPAGLTLDGATGVISGTPTGSGPATFTITLTDAANQTASQAYTVSILAAPSITTTTLPGGETGVAYSQPLAGTGGTTPYVWSMTAGSLPAGLTLDGASGVISGTPTGSGPATFTVTLTDANNQTASKAYTVAVVAGPSITTTSLPGGEAGVPYSQTLAGTGGTAPYTWSVTAGSLPAGLTLDGATGVISGTPTGSGAAAFTVTLTDVNGKTSTKSYSPTFLAAPSITTATLPGPEVGAPYSQTLAGTGGTAPYTWSVTAGSLPAGLTLDGATGVISGTPTGSGPATFTVTLTDASGKTATQTYTLKVAATPSITTGTLPGGGVGAAYNQTLTGTGGTGPYRWSVTAGSLPAGLTLNGATGVISGTPTTLGSYAFTITLTDGSGKTISRAYSMTVLISSLNSRPIAATPNGLGYWLVTPTGTVTTFGNAAFFGSMTNQPLNKPIVGIASTSDGKGYWLVASDGGVFAFGDAGFYGSEGGQHLNRPIIGIASTPDGKGYWLVASDGGVFAIGDAGFYGSEGGQPLNKPIVGIATAPAGKGYWLVASDAGVFAFGNAVFYGSGGGHAINKPIVGIAATPSGNGYWMAAADGGVFAFGGAAFYGSMGGRPLNQPVEGIAATASGKGYWLAAADGGVFSFGSAAFTGSIPGL
jgi:hypothetical protein